MTAFPLQSLQPDRGQEGITHFNRVNSLMVNKSQFSSSVLWFLAWGLVRITLNASKPGFVLAKEIILIVVSRWNSTEERAEIICWGSWHRAGSQQGDGAAQSAGEATNSNHQVIKWMSIANSWQGTHSTKYAPAWQQLCAEQLQIIREF